MNISFASPGAVSPGITSPSGGSWGHYPAPGESAKGEVQMERVIFLRLPNPTLNFNLVSYSVQVEAYTHTEPSAVLK